MSPAETDAALRDIALARALESAEPSAAALRACETWRRSYEAGCALAGPRRFKARRLEIIAAANAAIADTGFRVEAYAGSPHVLGVKAPGGGSANGPERELRATFARAEVEGT